MERNLRAPLVGHCACGAAQPASRFTSLRSRFAPATRLSGERARFARHPSDILITTPESLYLLLTSNAREVLRSVETVVLDEIHALVPHQARLPPGAIAGTPGTLCGRKLQRIGLSATQRPLEEVAQFLGGRREPSRRSLSPRCRANSKRSTTAIESAGHHRDAASPRRSICASRFRSRTWRVSTSRAYPAARRRKPGAAVDLERHSSQAAGAGPRASLDHHLRQQPAAGRAHFRRDERSRRRSRWCARITAASPSRSARKSKTA